MNNNYISDGALDAYYARIFEDTYGYNPHEGPYGAEDEEEEE